MNIMMQLQWWLYFMSYQIYQLFPLYSHLQFCALTADL